MEEPMRTPNFVGLICAVLTASGALAEPVSDPELQAHLELKVNAYANTLRGGNGEALKALLSSEMLERIHTRGGGRDFHENLRAFVAREQGKLMRELGRARATLSIQGMDVSADGMAVEVWLSANERSLPKPFFFVYENGEYKLNIVSPRSSGDATLRSMSSYSVKNDDAEMRTFSCSNGGPWNIAAKPGSLMVYCEDSCSSWFDGTRFSMSTGITDCDYNSWGVDMTIKGGKPVCSDPC
jgi:hypothetical protein